MRTKFCLSVACGIALCISAGSVARADLLVTSRIRYYSTNYSNGNRIILRFDDRTGALINQFGYDTESFAGMTVGPDERIYVTSNIIGWGDVYRFTRNGKFLGGFDTHTPTGGTATYLIQPGNLTFGPDGNCYVIGSGSLFGPDRGLILRYDGVTRAFNDYFVTNAGAPGDLAFGREGHLYIADAKLGIVRYNGKTGEFMDTFVSAGSAGVSGYFGFIFGPDGNLYVRSHDSNAVVRFDGNSGAFLDYFVAPGSGGLKSPGGLAFGPDGNLYVSSSDTDRILRYDGHTGAFLDVFATDAAMTNPANLVFTPPLPQLQIKHAGDTVEISWPNSSSAPNWTLAKQRSLDATNEWTVLTNTPLLEGTNYVVTDQRDGIPAFYRLEQH
ncbi:MAG: hypothetical protein DME23_24645 [Verrucomicrobia bacterium]|nr:MAG: hypothetical protein DME23_24645 [Verrucomicrobiota bacterium]